MLATGFAIFAGFVIFLAFTTYDQSRAGAEAEALLVVQQFETAQFLAPETRDRLSGEIVCYGRSVVDREWPEMQEGDLDEAINPWGLALFRTIRAADPSGTVQETAFAKWLDQTLDREEARRDRIHGAAGITPTTIWIVLLLSAAIVFAFMLFFADPAEMKRSQGMLVGSATTIVAATLRGMGMPGGRYGAFRERLLAAEANPRLRRWPLPEDVTTAEIDHAWSVADRHWRIEPDPDWRDVLR